MRYRITIEHGGYQAYVMKFVRDTTLGPRRDAWWPIGPKCGTFEEAETHCKHDADLTKNMSTINGAYIMKELTF